MPFTLAHPAAVLPVRCLWRRWTVLPALVIGSLIPDVGHFLPLGVTGVETHRLVGLLWFCLPLGIASYVVFRVLLERPLTLLCPRPVRQRLLARRPRERTGRVSSAAVVVVSVGLGALSHVAWDSFTHQTGAAVRAWPVLRRVLLTVGPYNVRLYHALQHGSTVVGLTVIALWLAVWFRRAPVRVGEPKRPLASLARFMVGLALVAVPAAVGLVTAVRALPAAPNLAALQSFAERAAVTGLQAFLAGLLALGCLWWALIEGPARLTSARRRKSEAAVPLPPEGR
jgi:hypothetical protein